MCLDSFCFRIALCMNSAPLIFSEDLFRAHKTHIRLRATLGWSFLALTFLGFIAWAALMVRGTLDGVVVFTSLFAQFSWLLGVSLLLTSVTVYAWKRLPWQERGRPLLLDGDRDEQITASGWIALEQAYALAKQVQRPMQPVHVLLGSCVPNEGAVVLARLGIGFDALHEPSLPLLREGDLMSGEPQAADAVNMVLERALALGLESGRGCGAIELIRACLQSEASLRQLLERAGANADHIEAVSRWLETQSSLKIEHDRFVRLAAMKPDSDLNRTMTARQTSLLNSVSEDLTRLAKYGSIPPVIERELAWKACVRAWEGGARCLVVVGPEGAGKTTFIEGIARRMVEERVPSPLFDRRLVSVHVQELVSGADAGEISERFLQLAAEVAQSGNILLVLEGIEALVGAGYGGTHDLFDAFSHELERYGLYVIATTTPDAWTRYVEPRVFGKRATKIELTVPDRLAAERILFAHASGLEYQQAVFFSYGAIDTALTVGASLPTGMALPGNALEWLREAAAMVRSSRGERAMVTRDDVGSIIEEKTGIPATSVQQDEAERLLSLEDRLKVRVVGQEDAVRAVARAMRRARADVRDGRRPIASFLFLGPTGVGKTELAKCLAAEYFGSEDRMIRLDCSEYQAPSSLERLIGQARDERGGVLTEAVRKKPYALVLLDEIEKAHPDILTLFLQVLDDGRLTDGNGRTIDFTHTIVIATSNAASPYIQQRVREGATAEQLKRELLERELQRIFRPELLNRFDSVEVFHPLTLLEVEKIAWLLLHGFERRMQEKGILFQADDAAVSALAKDGFDPEFGARPLRRLLQERIETAVADLLLRKQLKRGDRLFLNEHGQMEVRSQ